MRVLVDDDVHFDFGGTRFHERFCRVCVLRVWFEEEVYHEILGESVVVCFAGMEGRQRSEFLAREGLLLLLRGLRNVHFLGGFEFK